MADHFENWRAIWSFESWEAVQEAAVGALHEAGVNVPREDCLFDRDTQAPTSHGAFFGVSLECGWQPTLSYLHGECGDFQLPRFYVEAVNFLEERSSREGIFRKAGSVARQKSLKLALESGSPSIPKDSNVHDVACLLKQYLRELPEPLITTRLLPVFEASYSLLPLTDRLRCVLLACLLLPPMHLKCLCVLMKLLHSVSEVSSESLMDASNLAIVLAPNIMRPHIDIANATLGNPLKHQAAIVQLLIENARWIGKVPCDVGEAAEAIQVDLLRTKSLETVLEDGSSKGRDLPPRYGGAKQKKQRTTSLSGLVLGLGNRLWPKGGVASESCDNHVTGGGGNLPKRRTSMKRHSSADDLLCHESSKRRATQQDSTPQPRPPTGTMVTPDTTKRKRRHILSRQRHSGSRRRNKSVKTSKFQLAQHKFFNFRFSSKGSADAQQEVGGGGSSSSTQLLPTQQFVFEPDTYISVEGDHVYKSKLLGPHIEACPPASNGHPPTGNGLFPTSNGLPPLSTCRDQQNEATSVDLCDPSKRLGERALPTSTTATLKELSTDIDTMMGVAYQEEGVVNQTLPPLSVGCALPAVSHVPSERPTKRVKCDIMWGEEDSMEIGGGQPPKIPSSKSDFSIEGSTNTKMSDDQSAFKFVTPRGIPSSKSHPTFPFSQPRPRQQEVRFPFLDPKNEQIEKASFPFTPHVGGLSNIQFPDPLNDPIQKASFPLTPFPRTPSMGGGYQYSFANPTPVNLRPLAHANSGDTDSLVGDTSVAQNLNKAFVNDSQFAESDQSVNNPESVGIPTVVQEATPSLMKGSISSKTAVLRRLSSIHGKATPMPLDEAFLQTPFPPSANSPNLLEKITSEIALRHNFTPAPKPISSHVRPSTDETSLSNNQYGGLTDDSEAMLSGGSRGQVRGSGEESQSLLDASEREMFKDLVHRVNDSYKKAVGEGVAGSELDQQSCGSVEMMSDGSLQYEEGVSKSDDSASVGGESECFDNFLPHKLKFDSSNCESDLSTASGPAPLAPSTGIPLSVDTAPVKPAESPTAVAVSSKTGKARSRQLVTPRSSARRKMAYSATLGLSEQLIMPRGNPRRNRQSMKQSVSSGCVDVASAGQSTQMKSHRSSARAALSASLGITEISLGGGGQGGTRGKSLKRPLSGKDDKLSPPDKIQTISHPTSAMASANQSGQEDNNVQSDSPVPALLQILSENGVPVLPQHKDVSSDGAISEVANQGGRRLSKSKSTTNIKSCHGVNMAAGLKPPHRGKVYAIDEPISHKFRAIGGKVESDCSVVTRPPSPRLPFGLKSPWFRSSNKEQSIAHSVGATEDGPASRRAKPYVVDGPIPIPQSGHTFTKGTGISHRDITDENSIRGYRDDSHVI